MTDHADLLRRLEEALCKLPKTPPARMYVRSPVTLELLFRAARRRLEELEAHPPMQLVELALGLSVLSPSDDLRALAEHRAQVERLKAEMQRLRDAIAREEARRG